MSGEAKVALAVVGIFAVLSILAYLDYRRLCRNFERDREADREVRERIEALENVVDRNGDQIHVAENERDRPSPGYR